MAQRGALSLINNGNDMDEIRAKGMLRIAALAEWLNSDVRPNPEMVQRRLNSYAKDYMLSAEDINEIWGDVNMAVKKGKKGFDYVREGKPSFSQKAGNYMKYLKNITPKEYESIKREISLSNEGQSMLLENPGVLKTMTGEQKQAAYDRGRIPNITEEDYAGGKMGSNF